VNTVADGTGPTSRQKFIEFFSDGAQHYITALIAAAPPAGKNQYLAAATAAAVVW